MSDNVKTVEQFLETARLETGDVWMDNHDWRHLIEMVEQLAADLADVERLKSMLSDCVRMLEIVGVDSIPGDILAALAEHQRGEG